MLRVDVLLNCWFFTNFRFSFSIYLLLFDDHFGLARIAQSFLRVLTVRFDLEEMEKEKRWENLYICDAVENEEDINDQIT